MIHSFNSEKLQTAKLALRQADKATMVAGDIFKTVAGGVTVYFGQKFREAEEAFKETGRKDKELWKLTNGVAKRIK